MLHGPPRLRRGRDDPRHYEYVTGPPAALLAIRNTRANWEAANPGKAGDYPGILALPADAQVLATFEVPAGVHQGRSPVDSLPGATSLRSLGSMTVAQPLIELDASYARAVPRLSVPWTAAPAPAPELLLLNTELADELGLDAAALRAPAGVALLTGHELPEGVATVAQAYAGHQFGFYQPRLGDGRALLLGEVVDRAGHRRDLHLKGSGRTPFARGGDGRAAVGPMLREYLIGEAMHAPRDPDHAGACPSSPPASRCRASSSCPARCSAGWPRATCGWARSSTPPPPATPTCCAPSPTTPSPATTPTPPTRTTRTSSCTGGSSPRRPSSWPAGCWSGSCTA